MPCSSNVFSGLVISSLGAFVLTKAPWSESHQESVSCLMLVTIVQQTPVEAQETPFLPMNLHLTLSATRTMTVSPVRTP